jgi:hypothetical protein
MLTSSINSNNNIFSKTLKPNYKSTPMIKNSHLNLNNDEVEKVKDNLNTNLNIDHNFQYNSNQILSSNYNRKLTPKNTNIPKNMHFNLWRKPVMLGGGLPIQANPGETLISKNSSIKQRQNNLKTSYVNNQTKDTTNILSTNNTESKKDIELTSEYQKNVSPTVISPKQSTTTKFKIKKIKQQPVSPGRTSKAVEKEPPEPINNINSNYYTNYNTTLNLQTDSNNIQSEILSSILNFKTLLKSNEAANNIEKLFRSEEDLDKINALNSKLNKCSDRDNMNFQSTIFKENKIYLDENTNFLRRDSSIENKPINVINANMLNEFSNATRTKTEENEAGDKKTIIMNEIAVNSDMRLKRYEILLDFINSNLKEINQLMVGTPSDNAAETNTLIYNCQDEMQKIEEVNSNKLSSLHSKINLNSKFNLEDESSQFRKDNFHKPKEESQTLINLEIANDSNCFPNKNNPELNPSFLISSINSDFYQNFLEESFIQNDVSEIQLKRSQTKKVDRMLSYESDKTPLQYVSRQSNFANPSVKPSQPEESNNISGYGEENLDDSDLDKTKENVITNDPRKVSYNQVIKDMERVKLFVKLLLR